MLSQDPPPPPLNRDPGRPMVPLVPHPPPATAMRVRVLGLGRIEVRVWAHDLGLIGLL